MPEAEHPVWIPDDKNLFAKARIVKEENGEYKVEVLETKEMKTVPSHLVENVNPSQFDLAADIAELTYLNEPSVVSNLYTRWKNGMIYTYSGLFLVAVNPYQQLDIYNSDTIELYKQKPKDDTPPHIFSVAQAAYRSMIHTISDQSILITGESGAGKTENTKKVIKFLSNVSNNGINGIDERIWQTNPILEAFGNAMTIRNTNSSRFGKFVKIQFSLQSQDIVGASIEWYLLEKSRVVTQHKNERNYHVFYQLLAGADEKLRQKLFLTEKSQPSDFNYLKSAASEIPGVDDHELFKQLTEAFKIIGFSTDLFEKVLKTLAAVLWLGEVQFRALSADQGTIIENEAVAHACSLLGVTAKDFTDAVLRPFVKVGKESVKQSRNANQAKVSTDALSKALYEKLFGFIVDQINKLLGSVSNGASCIGVLDIAGFEIFDTNSFEQLCINYTNEKLQQFFNHHVFVLEQEEYLREKVDWEYKDYGADLQPTIALIEQSTTPMGILCSLDEESVLSTGTENAFNEKLAKYWGDSNPKFKPSRLGNGFTVDHYAQSVEYDTSGWIEKNRDPLSDSIVQLLSKSSNTLIKSMFEPTQSQQLKGKSKSAIFRTVGQRHKKQLNDLISHLSSTNPHFVRCILPNSLKSPNEFSNHLVLDQLRYNGVLEGIRIARSGFPNRLEFKEFETRYLPLVNTVGASLGTSQCSSLILESMKLNPADYKVGLSKVFFRSGVLADLEHKLEKMVAHVTSQVQALSRGKMCRVRLQKLRFKKLAAQKIAHCFKLYHTVSGHPWWQLTDNMKTMLQAGDQSSSVINDARMRKMEVSLRTFEEKELQLTSELNKVRGSLLQSLKDNEELHTKISMQKTEHEHSMSLSKERDTASAKALQDLAEQHTQLKTSKSQLEHKITELKSKCERLNTGLEKANSDVQRMSETADKCKVLHDEVAQCRAKIAELNALLEETKTAHAKELEQSNAGHDESLKSLQADLEKNHQTKISELQSEIEAHKSELQVQTNKHADNIAKVEKSVFDAQSQISSITKKYKELEEQSKQDLASKDEELANSKAKFDQEKVKMESQLDERNAYENSKLRADLENAEKQLKLANGRIEELKADLKSSKIEYNHLKDEFVAAQNVIRTNELSYKRMTEELKTAKEQAANADSKAEIEELRSVKLKYMKELRLSNERNEEYKLQIDSMSVKETKADKLQQLLRDKTVQCDQLTAQAAARKSMAMEYNELKKTISDMKRRNNELTVANSRYMLEEKNRPMHADLLETQRHQELVIKDLQQQVQDLKEAYMMSQNRCERMRQKLGDSPPPPIEHSPVSRSANTNANASANTSAKHKDPRFNKLVDLQLQKAYKSKSKDKFSNEDKKLPISMSDKKSKPLHMVSHNRMISDSTHVESISAKNFELEESLSIHKKRLAELQQDNDHALFLIGKAKRTEDELKLETKKLQKELELSENKFDEIQARQERIIKEVRDQLHTKTLECNNLKAAKNVNLEYETKIETLTSTLNDVTAQRDQLSEARKTLEKRLVDLSSNNGTSQELLDNLAAMGEKEKQLLSENEDMKWNLQSSQNDAATVRKNLEKAEVSAKETKLRFDKLQDLYERQTAELNVEKRAVQEYKERYLIAERELAPYRRQTASTANEPAFL